MHYFRGDKVRNSQNKISLFFIIRMFIVNLSFIKWEDYSSFFKVLKHIACILKLKHHWMNKKKKLSEEVDFKEIAVKEFFYAENHVFFET